MNRFNDDESSGEEEEVILLEEDFGTNITQEGKFTIIKNLLVMHNF
jgi:hypothetical protein